MRSAFGLCAIVIAGACAHAPLVSTGSDEYDVFQVVLRDESRREGKFNALTHAC
jgi:hypothetical protein